MAGRGEAGLGVVRLGRAWFGRARQGKDILNKLANILKDFPWLEGLPPSVCWAWVAFYGHVARFGSPAGTIKDRTPGEWAEALHVARPDFCFMFGAAKKGHAIERATGRTGELIIDALADPKNLAPSTLRTRKYRAKQEPGKADLFTATMQDAREDRQKLSVMGLKTPTSFPAAWLIGMSKMQRKGIKDPGKELIRHWKQTSKTTGAPPCSMSWLNDFVSRSVGRKVNLTHGLQSHGLRQV